MQLKGKTVEIIDNTLPTSQRKPERVTVISHALMQGFGGAKPSFAIMYLRDNGEIEQASLGDVTIRLVDPPRMSLYQAGREVFARGQLEPQATPEVPPTIQELMERGPLPSIEWKSSNARLVELAAGGEPSAQAIAVDLGAALAKTAEERDQAIAQAERLSELLTERDVSLERISDAHDRAVKLWRESNPTWSGLPPTRTDLMLWVLDHVGDLEREHASAIANVQQSSNNEVDRYRRAYEKIAAEADARIKTLQRQISTMTWTPSILPPLLAGTEEVDGTLCKVTMNDREAINPQDATTALAFSAWAARLLAQRNEARKTALELQQRIDAYTAAPHSVSSQRFGTVPYGDRPERPDRHDRRSITPATPDPITFNKTSSTDGKS